MRIRRSLWLAVATALLCSAAASSSAQDKTLTTGKRYTLDAGLICMTEGAARELIDIRNTGDFVTIPVGCKFHDNVGFSFEAKLPLKGPTKLIILSAEGKRLCHDTREQKDVPCDIKIVPYAVFVGTAVLNGSPVRAYVYMRDTYSLAAP